YLICIALVGFPIMIAEIIIGRSTSKSPVAAFNELEGKDSLWNSVGKMGILAGFVILSYYSVVAGWAMNYFLMSMCHFFNNKNPDQIMKLFGVLVTDGPINIFWHFFFMILTVGIVYNGVQGGIEKWSRILMPALFLMMIFLLITGIVLDPKSFGKALQYVFLPNNKLKPSGALEALGHAFFTLSLGMGAMLTYGSYLSKDDDIPKSSFWVCVMDTLVALVACLVIFPILFAFDKNPAAGPGLVFKTMPVLFSQIKGGLLISMVFFLLLTFAALTSAISLLEVVVSYCIDNLKWERHKATLISGGAIFLFGIPSAMTIFSNWEALYGKNFFDTMDYLASNWLLPLGGLLIALYVGWFMDSQKREEEFMSGTEFNWLYHPWLWILRIVAPILVFIVLLNKIGILPTEVFNQFFYKIFGY
ncbi:MAG: sodium-dependent transporter, partial [Planctomycetota bacterium]